MPDSTRLDVTRAAFITREFPNGELAVVLSDGTVEVLLTGVTLSRRDLSFAVGRLERQLQVLGGRLRG